MPKYKIWLARNLIWCSWNAWNNFQSCACPGTVVWRTFPFLRSTPKLSAIIPRPSRPHPYVWLPNYWSEVQYRSTTWKLCHLLWQISTLYSFFSDYSAVLKNFLQVGDIQLWLNSMASAIGTIPPKVQKLNLQTSFPFTVAWRKWIPAKSTVFFSSWMVFMYWGWLKISQNDLFVPAAERSKPPHLILKDYITSRFVKNTDKPDKWCTP